MHLRWDSEWDWDLDWDDNWVLHDHNWHWPPPWSISTHLWPGKCPLRKRWMMLRSGFDDLCWPSFCHEECVFLDSFWYHRSCLTGRAYIENGEEEDTHGKGTFKVLIDVHHFQGDELQLKLKNQDTLILSGKHKSDRANRKPAICITRSFTRKYRLPRYYDGSLAKASLSKDGILTIIVPPPPTLDDTVRVVDIIQTDSYYGTSKAIEENGVKDEKTAEDPSGQNNGSPTNEDPEEQN